MSAAHKQFLGLDRAQLIGYVFLCLIWGSTWMAIRIVVRDVPPLQAAGARFALAGAALLMVAAVQKRKWPSGKQQWKTIVVLSITTMTIPYALLFWGEQYVTSSMTAVMYSAMPLVISLLTPTMMHQRVPRSAIYAMLVGLVGLAALFYSDISSGRQTVLGEVAIAISVLLSGWSSVYAKRRLANIDSAVATGLQLFLGFVFLVPAILFFESHKRANWNTQAVVATVFLALLGSSAAFWIYYWLLKMMQPYRVSTATLVFPIIALFEGALLLGEPVRPLMLVAIVVVLGSVAAVLRAEAAQTRTMSEKPGAR